MFFEWNKDRRDKFKVKIDICDPFLFHPLTTAAGNRHSVTFLIRIVNKSNSPVHISDIQLIHRKSFSSSCEKEPLNYMIYESTPDGAVPLEFDKNMLTLPTYLGSYGELSGRVLIVSAGGNYMRGVNKIKIRIVTSRGDVVETINVFCGDDDIRRGYSVNN
jgi:hypothetical protein